MTEQTDRIRKRCTCPGQHDVFATACPVSAPLKSPEERTQTDRIRQWLEEQTDIPVLRDALLAASRAMDFDSRDWSLDRTDALLYGLMCGWGAGDESAWEEVAVRHGWHRETVENLRRRRDAVAKLIGDES